MKASSGDKRIDMDRDKESAALTGWGSLTPVPQSAGLPAAGADRASAAAAAAVAPWLPAHVAQAGQQVASATKYSSAGHTSTSYMEATDELGAHMISTVEAKAVDL